MAFWNKNNPEQPNSDEEAPDDDASIINEAPVENAAPSEETPTEDAPEFLSAEQLDELYDEDGAPRWETEDGTPCDKEGHPIPSVRPSPFQAEAPPAEAETTPPAAPERARPNFRSPFADGLLSAEERAQAEELVTPDALNLIETISARIADRIVAADRQQNAMARDLGIAPEYQDEVLQRMIAVHPLVPHNLRGTKQGNDAALLLAAMQEAGDTGSVIDVIQRWGNRAPAEAPQPKPAPAAPQPRKQTPFMAPSARTTVPRGAPEAARPKTTKMVGALPVDVLALIQAERTSQKNGR